MAFELQLLGEVVRVDGGVWSAASPSLAAMLNQTEAVNRTGLQQYAPDPDERSAHEMLDRFGGQIVRQDQRPKRPRPKPEDEPIY